MTVIRDIEFKRGTLAAIMTARLLAGEPAVVWDDTGRPRLVIGDRTGTPQELQVNQVFPIANVAGLQVAIDAKSNVGHTHADGDLVSLSWGKLIGVPATFPPPIAAPGVLGGVQPGANVTIDAYGRIAVAGPSTVAPKADGSATPGSSGAWADGAHVHPTDTSREPAIALGTAAQVWTGNKTWATLNTALVPESGNLYFTNARAIGAPLTGYAAQASAAVTASDSILTAIGKLEGNANSRLLATAQAVDSAKLGGTPAASFALIANVEPALGSPGTSGYLLASTQAGARSWVAPYSHPTGDGNLHVPATGTTSSGMVLTAGATAGSMAWATPTVVWSNVVGAPQASTANPGMNGAAAPGSTGKWADGGHVHPVDTSREASLGNPATSGYQLASTAAGLRSWVAPYAHPTGDGNLHVPATGTSSSGLVLTAGATAGSLAWTTPTVAWVNVTGAPTKVSQFLNDSAFITSASVPVASGTIPAMNGAAATGASGKWADGAHVHPTDTSREPALGNPASDGYILASTAAGVRSWIAAGAVNLSAPGTIGATTPGAGYFTSINATGSSQIAGNLGVGGTANGTYGVILAAGNATTNAVLLALCNGTAYTGLSLNPSGGAVVVGPGGLSTSGALSVVSTGTTSWGTRALISVGNGATTGNQSGVLQVGTAGGTSCWGIFNDMSQNGGDDLNFFDKVNSFNAIQLTKSSSTFNNRVVASVGATFTGVPSSWDQGTIAYSTSGGLALIGKTGSAYDWSVWSVNASVAIIGVLTGGYNVAIPSGYLTVAGTVTASQFNGSGAGLTGNGLSFCAGSATTLIINGSACTFHWSGQSGQPAWLWGGASTTDMYVYNPSNFNVNAATYLIGGGLGSNLYGVTRTSGTTYTNSSGRVLWVYLFGTNTGGTNNGATTVTINGTQQGSISAYGQPWFALIPIPNGATYKFTATQCTISAWYEM
jgi:hypothetical protein